LRGSTIVHLKVESEPSWLATSSMNSNPASVGSGGCSRRDDEAPLPRCSWWSIPDPSRREPSRSALTFERSTLAVLSARTRRWCGLRQTHHRVPWSQRRAASGPDGAHSLSKRVAVDGRIAQIAVIHKQRQDANSGYFKPSCGIA